MESAELAKKTWAVMVKKYMIEDAITQPMVTLLANDNWVEFTLRYTVDFKRRRITKDKLMRALLQEVEGSKGRVQMASTTIEITKFPGQPS